MKLTCRQLTEIVTDYVEGRMTFVERARFQFHLGTCKNCRAYVRQYRATVGVLGALGREPAPPIPADVQAELLQRFRSWKPKS